MPTDMPKSATAQAALYGEALARLRTRRRLTQSEAAKAAGIGQSAWARYEGGVSSILRVNNQQTVVESLGFTMDDFMVEVEAAAKGQPLPGSEQQMPDRAPAAPEAAGMTFPLAGYAKAGVIGAVTYDDVAPQVLDLSSYLGGAPQFVTVTGESMEPLLEQGSIVSIDRTGVPRKGRLCVVLMNDGTYFVKKYQRMTSTEVECIEMEATTINGRAWYAEKPIAFNLQDVKAVYPARVSIS